MTDGSKQGNDESPRSRDRQDSGPIVHEDLPDILEIFGSDPLVKGAVRPTSADDDRSSWPTSDHNGLREVVADPDSDAESDGTDDWDPMASPSDEVDEGDERSARNRGARRESESDSPSGDVASTPLSTERRLSEMRDILQLNEDRLGRLESTIQDLAKQTNFLPPKLRGLGKKVDELSTSVGDARLRSLLADIVSMGDLAEGALRALPDQAQEAHGTDARRYFRAMATRIEQILEAYDLQEIPTDAEFDPTVHNAIDVTSVNDEALDGQIIDVVRRGYRSEHSVLRYAEVTVGRYVPQPEVEVELEAEAVESQRAKEEDISATYAPFLGASSTAEDSKNLTMRGTKRSSGSNETTDDTADAERGVEPPSA